MKNWFSRKNRQAKDVPQEYYQQPRPKFDVSGTYDYDKIAQNQFLTPDTKEGEYFRTEDNYTGRSDATLKEQRMAMDEEAFQRINQKIDLNIGHNQQEFGYLNQVSEEISNKCKIPVKRKGLFSRKENITAGYPSYSVQETYNIQDNQAQKYNSRVDYNVLKNEQTKLLDLSDIDDSNQDVNEINDHEFNSFYVDKQKDEQLTNRLFQPENYIPPKQVENVVITPAPTPAPSPAPTPTPTPIPVVNKVEPVTPIHIETPVVAPAPVINNDNTNSSNNIHQPIPTTALRYLTPIDEEQADLRVKKENRRFIKLRG